MSRLPADAADHDVRIRFFTPTAEVPTCGHATVGAHYARAVEYGLPSCSLVQKTGSGLLQRVEIHRDGDRVRVRTHQGVAHFGHELDRHQVDRLLRALGVGADARTDSGPVQVVSTGHSMGRPGDVRVSVETRSDGEILVSSAGDAATAFRGELHGHPAT